MVDQLYANVDVSAQLQQKLPAEPPAARRPVRRVSAREAIDRAAQELLGRPRVQTLFVTRRRSRKRRS